MKPENVTSDMDKVTWVTIRRFSHPEETQADVILLPDIHIAEKTFHWEMRWEQRDVDLVLAEAARAPFKKLMLFVNRVTAKLGKLNTVTKISKIETDISPLHGRRRVYF